MIPWLGAQSRAADEIVGAAIEVAAVGEGPCFDCLCCFDCTGEEEPGDKSRSIEDAV